MSDESAIAHQPTDSTEVSSATETARRSNSLNLRASANGCKPSGHRKNTKCQRFSRALTTGKEKEEDLGGQMSFLEHLDELRSRLIRSLLFVFLAARFAGLFRIAFMRFWPFPSSARWRKHRGGSADHRINRQREGSCRSVQFAKTIPDVTFFRKKQKLAPA